MVKRAAAAVLGDDPAPAYDSDLIVVLDMDECLIHSKFVTLWPCAYKSAPIPYVDDSSRQADSIYLSLPSWNRVQVYKRPFLEDFLQAVCSKYETHIYTSSKKEYAEPILDLLDRQGDRFANRWYRESCDRDETLRAYIKNLDRLSLNKKAKNLTSDDCLKRVVLVDNDPLSFLNNPTNGILVSSFYNDASDKTLPAVLELLKELEPLDDVRPTLDERFGLKAALSEIQDGTKTKEKQQWKAI